MATVNRTIAAVAVIAALLMTTTAFAQRGGDGQRRGGMRGGDFQRRGGGGGSFRMGGQAGGMQSESNLLRRSDVQSDLKLTDEQKTQLAALQEEMTAATRAMMQNMRPQRGGDGNDGGAAFQRGGFDMEAMRAGFEKAQKETDKKIQVILTPQQWTRLGQIKVQLAGARAILDPDIEKQLELSATQKLAIDKLSTSLREANQQIFQNGGANGVDRADMTAEVEKNNKYFASELDKILTAEQVKKLDGMKGEAFKADPNIQQSGRGTRGGDGGGRRRGGGTGGGTGGG